MYPGVVRDKSVFHRIARLLLLIALMVSIGGQWALLQTAAWVRMTVVYSAQTGSVVEGLTRAFDGTHPCRMCRAIKKGTDSERKDPKQETAKQKLELFSQERVLIVFAAPVARQTFAEAEESASKRTIMPPTPPPRCGLA